METRRVSVERQVLLLMGQMSDSEVQELLAKAMVLTSPFGRPTHSKLHASVSRGPARILAFPARGFK